MTNKAGWERTENPYGKMPEVNLAENISSYMLVEIKRDCWQEGYKAGAADSEAVIHKALDVLDIELKKDREWMDNAQIKIKELDAKAKKQVEEIFREIEPEMNTYFHYLSVMGGSTDKRNWYQALKKKYGVTG